MQKLVRLLATSTDINVILNTKHKEGVEPVEFSMTIAPFASYMEEAIREAKCCIDGPDKLSLWTDRLGLDTGRSEVSVA